MNRFQSESIDPCGTPYIKGTIQYKYNKHLDTVKIYTTTNRTYEHHGMELVALTTGYTFESYNDIIQLSS